MTTARERRELACWLTLAFRLEREPRRAINGLVLTADRKAELGLEALLRLEPEQRPAEIARYGSTLDRLIDAEGRMSAQAFLVERVLSMGGHIVPITDRRYPPHLVHRIGVERAPTVLTCVGDTDLWSKPGVAISGSRKAGESGLAFAREAGRAVAKAGGVVVCGLAAGVDREALEGALEAGGRAIGIAPEGLLHSRWTRGPEIHAGRLLVVSEFAPDDRWSVGRAMTRNRTIAGFSEALVIADCVASGGTTDQLEVHRDAGLPVYVRRGSGEGALVAELCRRPGVTPLRWERGPIAWPPSIEESIPAPEVDIACVVHLAGGRVSIRADAPSQLALDIVIDRIRQEYAAAARSAGTYPIPSTSDSGTGIADAVGEVGASYGSMASADPIVAALGDAGSKGATAKELQAKTGFSNARVQKRLRELRDANLVRKAKARYFDGPAPSSTERTVQRSHAASEPLPLFGDLLQPKARPH